MFNLNSNFQCWDLKQSTGGSQYLSRNLNTLIHSRFIHVNGFSELIDLWVIKIKKPMILCVCSRSRSSQQSTKRRSRSKNIPKFCLFYSHNNKIVWLSGIADTFNIWEILEVCKGLWAFFLLIVFFGTDWLGRQTPITWIVYLPSVRVCREISFFHVIHHFWGTNVIPAFLERSEYVVLVFDNLLDSAERKGQLL